MIMFINHFTATGKPLASEFGEMKRKATAVIPSLLFSSPAIVYPHNVALRQVSCNCRAKV